MHWPPADRPADSHADPTDAVGEPAGYDGGLPDEDAASSGYESSPTFAAYDAAGDSPWANRIVWSAAAAAAVCGGVWFTGIWEVRLDEPPAGALAEQPAAAVGGAGELWVENDWPENEAPGAEADLAALWGEEPEPHAEGHDHEHAAAFALMAEAPAAQGANGAALDDVSLTPPQTAPAPEPADPLVSANDLWSDPAPSAAPTMPEPHRNADEPAGGLYASSVRPTPVAPGQPVRSAALEATPTASTAKQPSTKPTSQPAADPFGGDPVAPGTEPTIPTSALPSAPGSATPGPAATAMDDPFAGIVTPASASATTSPKVTTADAADAAPEPGAAPGSPADPADGQVVDAEYLAAIDAAVAAGEVLQAHTELSRLWWDAPADRSAVRSRLDGTARQIYFDASSHFMTPRTVAAGETLADIAADLSVPEMYLARVNRVAPAAVQAGDELKVIRGPFGAALDLSGAGAGTLTMHAHGYYVRAFSAQATDVEPGDYTVGAKVRNVRGVRILLTGPDGQMVVLMSGPAPAGRPAVILGPADADQAFDLLETNGVLSVRP
ncbi:LysM peptidoglycan-binding domain-containing protein [Alienimonas californiensis]|uniref:LysM domain-containing protein n=1 Tax=Alienimonas californiensis TaxID=2527989 RepID=A0A517P8C5_9PLAN|nr:LysM peptidoglycan-binding domain-containing protein [Alienimonas californiensis]QDT15622.1 hypothetical protein CA12_17070 [Alienimonas californiensis]